MFSSLSLLVLVATVTADPADYCNIDTCAGPQNHTICLYPTDGASSSCGDVKERGVSAQEQEEILRAHNDIRQGMKDGVYASNNLPAAAEMPDLTWDTELATLAQRWADQCDGGHQDQCRDVRRFTATQSITVSTGTGEKPNWRQTVTDHWFGSLLSFYWMVGNNEQICCNNLFLYMTQIIWAKTTSVGCGLIGVDAGSTSTRRTYVCNYGPGGNKPNEKIYQKK